MQMFTIITPYSTIVLLMGLFSQVGGVFCLVLNSQLFYDASACPQLKEAQETWLEEQLSRATSSVVGWRPQHDSQWIYGRVCVMIIRS